MAINDIKPVGVDIALVPSPAHTHRHAQGASAQNVLVSAVGVVVDREHFAPTTEGRVKGTEERIHKKEYIKIISHRSHKNRVWDS